jgi:hypothetical protein
VTIEARFTASSRSNGSHREWTHLHGGNWREFGDDRNRRVFGMPKMRKIKNVDIRGKLIYAFLLKVKMNVIHLKHSIFNLPAVLF